MRRVPAGLFVFLAIVTLVAAVAGATSGQSAVPAATRLRARVVASYPHDRNAFTQGLIWRDGVLYESTGLVGKSSLRIVELTSGTVRRQVACRRRISPRDSPTSAIGCSS
jgi:glutaminyl-peptide cyclotransferase